MRAAVGYDGFPTERAHCFKMYEWGKTKNSVTIEDNYNDKYDNEAFLVWSSLKSRKKRSFMLY